MHTDGESDVLGIGGQKVFRIHIQQTRLGIDIVCVEVEQGHERRRLKDSKFTVTNGTFQAQGHNHYLPTDGNEEYADMPNKNL
jgi:hypothetical protein